jgi:PAS domain S-box-containing protein
MARMTAVRGEAAKARADHAVPAWLPDVLLIMDDAVVVVDDGQRVCFFNAGAERVFDYRAAEVLGCSLDLLLPSGSGPRHAAHVRAFEAEDQASRLVGRRGEIAGRRRDGTTFAAEASVTKHRDGSRTYFIALLRDITQRKADEEALRRSESSYRTLVESLPFGTCRFTPGGQLLLVNSALVSLLGHDSARDVLALDLARDVFADAGEQESLLNRAAAAERVEGMEAWWRRRDGQRILVRLNGRPVRSVDGAIDYFELVVEDITAHRAMEADRRQAQKLDAVSQLTVGLAHNLNNQLSVVVAGVEMLELSLPSEDKELREVVADMRAAATTGAGMVHHLLTFSRRQQLTLEPLDLSSAMPACVDALRSLLPQNIQLAFMPCPLPCMVRADLAALSQAMRHLATNARDAMPNGGTLRVTLTSEQGNEGSTEGMACLSVEDTGTGMDEAVRERAFEPFFTTKPQGAGTGLGLAMVYGLVRQHGGRTALVSAPGRGTTVRLCLPLLPQASDTAPATAELRGGAETILLAEDEEALRRTTTRVLQRFGYTVVAARDGAHALDLFRQHGARIDLVISDVVMPNLDGRQLRQALCASDIAVPFMFTSGFVTRDARDAEALDPRVPFLAKPWAISEFLAMVRDLLDRKALGASA